MTAFVVIAAHADQLDADRQRLMTHNGPARTCQMSTSAESGGGRRTAGSAVQARSAVLPTLHRPQRSGHTNAPRTCHDLTEPNSAGEHG